MKIRPQRPETAHWQFVNIPIHASPDEPKEYDANRDCPHGDCVVAKIEEFERVLSDRQKPDRERLEAPQVPSSFRRRPSPTTAMPQTITTGAEMMWR
jgi:hypothetical protein